jgi:hypothetical protein|tara:strand:- start:1101 stop:1442 length:342 start_codon:yes stop_codon:yes gene_type:complete
MTEQNRNPNFGKWTDFESTPEDRALDPDSVSGKVNKVIMGRKREDRLIDIVNEMNTTFVKNLDNEVLVERTIEEREKIISRYKIPRSSQFYEDGFEIYRDDQGIPWYGPIPER